MGCQPGVGELARFLLGDQVQQREGVELGLDRAAIMERVPTASRLKLPQALPGEARRNARVSGGEPPLSQRPRGNG